MVAISRTLAVHPEIIFMDEPFNALDEIMRIKLQEELEKMWQEGETTVFFVTHDIEVAVYMADRVAVMSYRPGRILKNIKVNLDRPRDRTDERFLRIRERVKRILQR